MDAASHAFQCDHWAPLVFLSYTISVLGAYCALQWAGQVRQTTGWLQACWLAGAAVAMGGGAIWSMHFIAMIACRLPVPVVYDVTLTLASLVVAIVMTGIGLYVVGVGAPKGSRLLLGGGLTGLGVAAMHYTGMAAMELPAQRVYRPVIVVASVVIAIVAATAALWLAFNARRHLHRVAGSLVMGVAVCGMHYTAMAAVTFIPDSGLAVSTRSALESEQLGFIIFGLTLFVLALLSLGGYTEALRTSHARFEAVFNAAPIGVYLVDAAMRIRQVNPRARPVFGELEGLIGSDFVEVIHKLWPPATAKEIVAFFRHTLDTGEPYFNPEFSEERYDKKVREYYDWQIHRVPLPDGQSGVVCYFSDISAAVLAREALAGSEKRLRFMAESMPQKIFTAKPDGEIDYFSQQWTDFTGLAVEQIRDWGWRQFIHPDEIEANVARWNHSIETGEPFELEHRVRRHDGTYRWHFSRAHAMRDATGRVVMWIGSTTDIDAIKRLGEERRQLLEAERAARMESEKLGRIKDEFLATLSHELRTPLNAILGWAHLLGKDIGDEAKVRHAAEVIERNARTQAQLVSDLLDLSRIISGKMLLDVQTVEILLVVEAAVDVLRPAAEAKGVRLVSALDPITENVRGDPSRLQQIVWNLVSNAVKFTPRGGRVQVALAPTSFHVEITVSDTGKGITAEFLPHVFERFRQADASASRDHGGLGIGLALVKQLTELHGGSVRAESGGEGRGATFVVQLPFAAVSARADGGEVRAPSPSPRAQLEDVQLPGLRGIKVLVVDDEADTREVVRRILEECEAEVITAASANEGIVAFLKERPDVILSDIGMPQRDGYGFIAEVRRTGSKVPAAALTAFARPEDRTRATDGGYDTHVAKPVEPRELIATVASLAGRS